MDHIRFAALYLLAHGIIKLWLIIGLLRQRLWYYPTSIGIFGVFIGYQPYRFSFTHAGSLLLVTMLGVAITVLTLHEYRFLRKEQKRARVPPRQSGHTETGESDHLADMRLR
ncbi:DUF2127 domain-containing protein [Burkholderia cepacia]|uniref:DUF2127 domain-containing protein n=1 Tax=Burkholderia TaxID=32008 RepID=UPI000688C37D|nr:MULTISPECIES: DUF2127 domain-containing protein [Burkholderia]MDN7444297.1 DUF2127 domain-containing protein [Burkholderia cepacia]